MTEKKDCKVAHFEHFKSSDCKKLGGDAKILVALINSQSLTRVNLCKEAKISESTFSRHKRALENLGIIKETESGYALWSFVERPSLWWRLLEDLKKVSGDLITLGFYRLSLVGEPDPITGWYKKKYDEFLILGIFIHKGAIELEAIAKITFTGIHNAVVLTQALVDEGDLIWLGDFYEVKGVKPIYEGLKLSYRIVWLTSAPQYGSLISP